MAPLGAKGSSEDPFADFMPWSSKVFSLINPVLYNAKPLVLREYSIYTQTFQVIGNDRFSFLEMESRAGHWELRLLGPQVDCPEVQPGMYKDGF